MKYTCSVRRPGEVWIVIEGLTDDEWEARVLASNGRVVFEFSSETAEEIGDMIAAQSFGDAVALAINIVTGRGDFAAQDDMRRRVLERAKADGTWSPVPFNQSPPPAAPAQPG